MRARRPLSVAFAVATSGMTGLAGSGTARADGPESSTENGSPPVELRRNDVQVALTGIPWAPGVALGYARALARRFSLGLEVEYFVQRRGYWQLQSFAETLRSRVWLFEAFKGPFATISLTMAHSVWSYDPGVQIIALQPTLGIGWRHRFESGLHLGVSLDVRGSFRVRDPAVICTDPALCPAVRQGAIPRLALEVGYAF